MSVKMKATADAGEGFTARDMSVFLDQVPEYATLEFSRKLDPEFQGAWGDLGCGRTITASWDAGDAEGSEGSSDDAEPERDETAKTETARALECGCR